MIAHLWQSTWFAAIAALLTLAFRNNRAHIRFCLWLCASLKFLVPFALLISLGSRIHWQPAPNTTIVTATLAVAVQRIAAPFATSPPPRTIDWLTPALAALWTLGFFAIVTVRLRLWRRIRAALRASTPVSIAAPVEIRQAPGLLEPGVVGILRPVLLLPEGIAEHLTPAQLETVVSHELCHVDRRDNLFAAIHMLVEAVFWFHPFIWWIGARLVEERERACDEAVLSLGREPRDYADAIVRVCRAYLESPLVCVSGVTGANLKRRIEAIMSNYRAQTLNRWKTSLLAGAALAVLACPILTGVVMQVHAQTASPHRLVAMLFDFGSLSPDDQARAREAALQFVHSRMQPDDSVSVMVVNSGRIQVIQDFTTDKSKLEPVISQLTAAPQGSISQLSSIQSAIDFLAPIQDKKALLYFSAGVAHETGAALDRAIEAARQSNTAIYRIDVGGDVSGTVSGQYRSASSIHVSPSGDSQILSVPLDSLSGEVEIVARITNSSGAPVAGAQEKVHPSRAPHQFTFKLQPGSYTTVVVITQLDNRQAHNETIHFDVK